MVGLKNRPGFRALLPLAQEVFKADRLPAVLMQLGGRMGEVEDVADVIGWLCSEKSRWVSGSFVAANGGAARVG
jgi:NAD(P)-dependent dehydrogenase (short-subunit alcohol dehydrogenase family)